jgi:hypothetical protein
VTNPTGVERRTEVHVELSVLQPEEDRCGVGEVPDLVRGLPGRRAASLVLVRIVWKVVPAPVPIVSSHRSVILATFDSEMPADVRNDWPSVR